MTPDERKMLNDLADNISQAPAPPRDPEAEEIIRTRIGKRPDALYLMTQTALIQNLALQRAQQQIQDLQSRSAQGQVSGGSSWLGQQQSPGYAGSGQQQYASPATATGNRIWRRIKLPAECGPNGGGRCGGHPSGGSDWVDVLARRRRLFGRKRIRGKRRRHGAA